MELQDYLRVLRKRWLSIVALVALVALAVVGDGAEAMRALLHEPEGSYDVVPLDGAPLLPVTDSAVLPQLAGGALLVVASGRATRPQLQHSIAAPEAVDARILGAVVTMLPTKGADAYGAYTYEPRRGTVGDVGLQDPTT